MKINLRSYGRELGHWVEACAPFFEHAGQPALHRIKDQLDSGRDNLPQSFVWQIDRPVHTIVATAYDGEGRKPPPVKLGWRFKVVLIRTAASRKRFEWEIDQSVTEMSIVSAADAEHEIMRYHYDLKNGGQVGPRVHMQVAESFLKERSGVSLPVPRFPAASLLPTDCLDLALAEFFPFDWPRSQSDARGLDILRTGQRNRLLEMSRALVAEWDGWGSRMTPIAATQNCRLPDLQIA